MGEVVVKKLSKLAKVITVVEMEWISNDISELHSWRVMLSIVQ